MVPALEPGDLLAVRPARGDEPRPGQIVVARTGDLEIVKRVRSVAGDGSVWIEGDNAAHSTDSRTAGPVPRARIAGVVRARYWPAWRARLF